MKQGHHLIVCIRNGYVMLGFGGNNMVAGPKLKPGQWTHVALVYNKATKVGDTKHIDCPHSTHHSGNRSNWCTQTAIFA